MNIFSKIYKGLNLVPNSVSQVSVQGDLDVTTDGNLNFNNGTTTVHIVGDTSTQTLTNKTLDGNDNTFLNIPGGAVDLTGVIVNADVNSAAAIAYTKLNLSNSIVDSDVSTSAAIARNKLATGTASQVVVNDGSGNLSSQAELSPTLGGTGIANNLASTITISGSFPTTLTVSDSTNLALPTTGTLSTLAGHEILTNKTIVGSSNSISGITSSMISSGAATNGSLLTADGSGNTSFLPAPAATPVTNLLLNSNFAIWQRGTTFNDTTTDPNSYYTADRWAITLNGASAFLQVEQVPPSLPGSVFGLNAEFLNNTPTTSPELRYTLENSDSQQLYNKDGCFSINVKAAGNVNQIGIQFLSATQETVPYTTIGSEVLVTVNPSTFTLASITGQSIGTAMGSSGVIGIRLRVTGVSSGNIYDTGNGYTVEQAMMNVGSALGAYIPYGLMSEELSACQRYFEKSYNLNTAPGVGIPNPPGTKQVLACLSTVSLLDSSNYCTTKRTTPGFVNVYSGHTGTGGKIYNTTTATDVNTASGVSNSSGFIFVETSGNAVAGDVYLYNWSSDAEIY